MTGAQTTPAEAPPPAADHWRAVGLALVPDSLMAVSLVNGGRALAGP
ncbi:hypothetical protein ACN28C_26785 [Plantactinospora sp. WMMC1484]